MFQFFDAIILWKFEAEHSSGSGEITLSVFCGFSNLQKQVAPSKIS